MQVNLKNNNDQLEISKIMNTFGESDFEEEYFKVNSSIQLKSCFYSNLNINEGYDA